MELYITGSRAQTIRKTNQLDSKNRILKQDLDIHGDDIVDTTMLWDYDASGDHVWYCRDDGADSECDYQRWDDKSSDGFLTVVTEDSDGDFLIDRIETRRRHLSPDLVEVFEYDDNADGFIDHSALQRYNEQGDTIEESYDENGDENTDYYISHRFEYPDAVTKLRYTDREGNGSIESISKWTFLDPLRVLRFEWDNNADGVFDGMNTSEYNEMGLVTDYRVIVQGELHQSERYTYDSGGRLARVERWSVSGTRQTEAHTFVCR